MTTRYSVEFNGRTFTKYDRYWTTGPYDGERYLHRAVWVFHNGSIPVNHHIHHLDENPDNNDISNLECLPASEHLSLHMTEEAKCMARENMKKHAQPAACAWHKSPEAKQFHRDIAKKSWEREPVEKECEECGVKYETFFPTRSKFCGGTCKARARRSRFSQNSETQSTA